MKTTKSQSRYREIDIIKGITIIWVVLMHLELNPPIPDAAAQMGIFFLFSGFFFNPINTKALIIKKYNSLIIPLLWFWLISWCVALFKFDVPRYISEQHIDLSHTFGLLTNYSYLRVNILWFLMALFTTHILYNYLFYHIKCYKKELVIILIAIILYLSGSLLTGLKQHEPFHTIYENPWFPIGPFLVYQIYFVIGWYFKKYFLSNHWRLLKSVNAKLLNSVFMLVTRFSGLQTLSHFSNDYIGVGALKLGSPIFHECRTIHFQPDC